MRIFEFIEQFFARKIINFEYFFLTKHLKFVTCRLPLKILHFFSQNVKSLNIHVDFE